MKQGFLLILTLLSFSVFTTSDAISSEEANELELNELLIIWNERAHSKKGGDAYRILKDSASWYSLFKQTLEDWGDIGKRTGVEQGSIEIVQDVTTQEEWNLETIPMIFSEQERIDKLRYCVSFYITSKLFYPESYSYEKQNSYILKKYLHKDSDASKGLFLPSKHLQKILSLCEAPFKKDIETIDALVKTAYSAHLKREEERKAAELLRKKRIKAQATSKKEKPKTIIKETTENTWKLWIDEWGIYLFELIVFLIVVGIIMAPTLSREEREARAEEKERQRKEIGIIRNRLLAKYNDKRIVNKIANHQYWQGQTKEQLLDSLGSPDDTDTYVMKSETKETWKYKQGAKSGYALLIFLDNGKVVGWETL